MSKPTILLYCNVFDTTVGQSLPYMNFFSQFGDVVLVTSEMNLPKMIEFGDILAVPGGQDIYSDRYGAKPGFNSKNVNAHYEYLDRYLLLPWIETGKPIIGICRGMQALNVVCGGTLIRHINGHVQEDDLYWRYDTPQEMFTNIAGIAVANINSLHHQCVGKVAPGFDVRGWSDFAVRDRAKKQAEFKAIGYTITKNKDIIVRDQSPVPMVPEIMVHSTRPYVAFQYHPEEFNCPIAITLIEQTLKEYANKSKKVTEGARH